MSNKRVAINGLGRIGRLMLKKLLTNSNLEIVAVNDTASFETLAYLLKYCSEHGTFEEVESIAFENDKLCVGDYNIATFGDSDASKLPWDELAVDLVIDCSGFYTSHTKAQKHLDAGAKKVLISAAAGPDVPTVVFGINEDTLLESDAIISGASCSTVGLAPLAKALDEHASIIRGICTTIHALTPTQMTMDSAQPKGNLRRSRTASTNIIPTTAAAAEAIGRVLPRLTGRLTGSAIRVPVTQGSLILLHACIKGSDHTIASINQAMKAAKSDIFSYTEDELVSSDIAGTSLTAIFDPSLTKVEQIGKDKYLVEVAAWFDNETSYIAHFSRLVEYVCNSLNYRYGQIICITMFDTLNV